MLPSIFLISDMSPWSDCSSDFICCTSASAATVSLGTTTGLGGAGAVKNEKGDPSKISTSVGEKEKDQHA